MKRNAKNAAKAAGNGNAIANVVSKSTNEDAAKAAKKLDRTISKIANEIMAEVKNEVLGLNNWLAVYKRKAIKHSPEIAQQFEDNAKWATFVVTTKRNLNHVVVLTEGKDKETGEKTVIRSIKPVMWVQKSDKVSLPDYFGKANVVSYRYDKINDGKETSISDTAELNVTRSVKVPHMVIVNDPESGQPMVVQQTLPNPKGGNPLKVWDDKDAIFVPLEQMTFSAAEVSTAIKQAMLATFGSKAIAK